MKIKCVETKGSLFVVGGVYEKNENNFIKDTCTKVCNKGGGLWKTDQSLFHEVSDRESLVCVSFTGNPGIFTPGKSYDCERGKVGVRLFIVQDDLVNNLDEPDWYEVCRFPTIDAPDYIVTYKGGSAVFKKSSHVKNPDEFWKAVFTAVDAKQSISNVISDANEDNRITENKKRHSAFYGVLGASIYDEKPITPELYRELHAWAFDSTKS